MSNSWWLLLPFKVFISVLQREVIISGVTNFPMLKPVGTCLVTKFTNQAEVKIEPPGHWNNLTTRAI
jgi:hypothetical protein